MACPRTPCDLQERQEAMPGVSSTSVLHCTILPAWSMVWVAPSLSSFGCSHLEGLLPELLVTPSFRGFPPLLSFFKVSVSSPDLAQSGYGSPQSLLCWQPFAMFYLFCCYKTKCFSYLYSLMMGRHHWPIQRCNGRHFSSSGILALTGSGYDCLPMPVYQSFPPGQH